MGMVALAAVAAGEPARAEERGVFGDAEPVESERANGPAAQNGSTLGATVYKHMCVYCHGADGNGGGKAMAYLYPWPRDFRKGVFKHRSTPSGSLPLDKDIFRTISRGVPGTSMPAWKGALSEDEAWSVVEYIKGFSRRFKEEEPKPAIVVGEPPPTTPEAIAKGRGLYQELRCARCLHTTRRSAARLPDEKHQQIAWWWRSRHCRKNPRRV